MHKRRISQRAGAWVLSAAMLFNGLPLNVFAESTEDGIYQEASDTGELQASENTDSAGVDSSETGEGDGQDMAGSTEGTESTGEENSGGTEESGTISDESGENGSQAATDTQTGDNQNGTGTGASDGQDTTDTEGANSNTSTEENNDSGESKEQQESEKQETEKEESEKQESEKQEAEKQESEKQTTEETVTTHDALFEVLWSDEKNLADRREDQDLTQRFVVYQNGLIMDPQPQIWYEKPMEDSYGGTQVGTYRISELPDTDENGTAYSYSIKETVPAGYEGFTAEAFTDLDAGTVQGLLAELLTPDQELGLSLEEGADTYHADRKFGNYLRQYVYSGSISWNDNANGQNIRPDMEVWFRDHVHVTRDGGTYSSFRIHYEQNAEDPSLWNYQIRGLFAVKEDRTQAIYTVSMDAAQGYTTESGVFSVSENQTGCQSVFDLTKTSEEPEVSPDKGQEDTADDSDSTDETTLENTIEPVKMFSSAAVMPEEYNAYAQMTVAFLDKEEKAEGDYLSMVSANGITLSYRIGEDGATGSVQMVYDGTGWHVQDASALAALGISAENLEAKFSVSWILGTGVFYANDLPSRLTGSQDEITWDMAMTADGKTGNISGYCDPIVSGEAGNREYHFIPYYTNSETGEEGVRITIDLRQGDKKLTDAQVQEILSELILVHSRNNQNGGEVSLSELLGENGGAFQESDRAKAEYTYDEETNTIALIVHNLPWCDDSKTEYTYAVKTKDQKLTTDWTTSDVAAGWENTQNDFYRPTYNNSAASNHGTATDACYDNGTLFLRLSGGTSFEGTKIWLDENDFSGRPSPVWKLWRYPVKDGNSYIQASPVVSTVNGKKNQISFDIDNTVEAGVGKTYTEEDLPKYDEDGYPFIYLIREEENSGYEQIFGKVTYNEETGSYEVIQTGEDPYNGAGRGNDTSLYNGGTLSNRIAGTASKPVKKIWQNAAHQDSIQNVKVVLTLQYQDPDTDEWKDTDTQITMDGFRSEIQEKEASATVRMYDERGRLLNYRWVESAVFEDGEEVALNPVEGTDDEKTFSLKCNDTGDATGEKEYYVSKTTVEENGMTVIRNTLTGTTDYFVDKLWKGWREEQDEPDKNAPDDSIKIKVMLYQNGKPYKADGENITYYTIEKDGKSTDETIDNDRDWSYLIKDLPKFDADGKEYIYYAVEATDDGLGINVAYKYNVEELKVFSLNNAQIINSPGEGGKLIRVEKTWEDAGDADHHLPVEVGVWRVKKGETDSEFIRKVTLSESNNWWSYVSVSKANDEKDAQYEYFIREISLGDGAYTVYTDTDNKNGQSRPVLEENTLSGIPAVQPDGEGYVAASVTEPGVTVDYVNSDSHKYDVTYSIVPGSETGYVMDTYRVTNHRYGWINLQVTKNWIDEGTDSETRKAFGAELHLELANADKVSNVSIIDTEDGNSAVVVDGVSYPVMKGSGTTQTPAGAVQALTGETVDKNKEVVSFYNLPKYDGHGVLIQYKVTEYASVTDADGNATEKKVNVLNAKEETTLSRAEYQSTVSNSGYIVTGTLHALDEQSVEVTNRRSAIRDVVFYKVWIDEANAGNRPDIYFNLYRQDSVDTTPAKIGEFKPYAVNLTDDGYYLKYIFRNMPKYDKNGKNITYYATEGMHVQGSALDYIPAQYYYGDNAAPGTGTTVTNIREYLNGLSSYAAVTFDSDSNTYVVTNIATGDGRVVDLEDGTALLKEGGTFVNELRSTVLVSGKKIWKNIPGDFKENRLPALNFELKQQKTDENGLPVGEKTTIATLDGPVSTEEGKTEFYFVMKYYGKNIQSKNESGRVTALPESLSDVQPIPKYDENGRRYIYTLEEKFQENSKSSLSKEELENLYVRNYATNSYLVNNSFKAGTASLTVTKNWNNVIYRDEDYQNRHPDIIFNLYRFYKNADGTYTRPETVGYEVLSNGDASVTFKDLCIYAPDGTLCYYYVQEQIPNGYKETDIILDFSDGSITAVTESGLPKTGDGSSEIFTFNGTVQADGTVSVVSAKGTITNSYEKPGDVVLVGEKTWNDQNNAFGTRPMQIQISLMRYAAAQGKDNLIAEENILEREYTTATENEKQQRITLTVQADGSKSTQTFTGLKNTKEVKVISWLEGNTWKYEISGLDRYAPNGSEWSYKIKEDPVLLKDASGNTIGSYVENGEILSESGAKTEDSGLVTITMPVLNNELNLTSAFVKKTWKDQQLLISKLMKIKFQLWVMVGEDGVYQPVKTKSGSAPGFENFTGKYEDTVTRANNTWSITDSFTGLPTAVWIDGNYQTCRYLVVEKAYQDTGDGAWVELAPQWNAALRKIVCEGTTGRYEIQYVLPDQDADNTRTSSTGITNILSDYVTISFEKNWAGDSDNQFHTRPSSVRVKLYRRIAANGSDSATDWKELEKWNIAVDPATGKLTGSGAVSTTSQWTVKDGVASISHLPKYTNDGSQVYEYKVVEVGENAAVTLKVSGQEDGRDVVASKGTSDGTDGSYYYVTSDENEKHTVITNTLATTSLEVTKTWENDKKTSGESESFRPDSIKLTLYRYRLGKDGKKIQDSDENVTEKYNVAQPAWEAVDGAGLKNSTTWKCEFTGLPKYYGAYKNGSTIQGLKYVYYVTEKIQPGYLTPQQNADQTTVTNKATVFQMEKLDKDTNNSIRDRDLTFVLTGNDSKTRGYQAIWSRTVTGTGAGTGDSASCVEAVNVTKNGAVIYTSSVTGADAHVEIKGLPVGKYILSETQVPVGYEKVNNVTVTLKSVSSGNTQVLKITTSGSDAAGVSSSTVPVLTITDTKTSLDITKKSWDKKTVIEGTVFTLTPAEGSAFVSGKASISLKTTANGVVSTDDSQKNPTKGELIIGNTYILREISTPEGYILPGGDDEEQKLTITFKVADDGSIMTDSSSGYQISGVPAGEAGAYVAANGDGFTILNKPIQITLEKTDRLGNSGVKYLAGAVFKLTDVTAGKSKQVTAENNGKIVLKGTDRKVPMLQDHTYQLEEITAPEGYKLPDTHPQLTFTVGKDGKVTFENGYAQDTFNGDGSTVIRIKNDPVEISLIKKAAESEEKLLAGAVFKLIRLKGVEAEPVAENLTTDSNGKITLRTGNTNPTTGTEYKLLTDHVYQLEETRAAAGYEILKPFTFRIETNGTITAVEAGENDESAIAVAENQITLNLKDTRTAFSLDKVNAENTRESVKNVTLTVTDKNGEKVFDWTRAADGTVSVTKAEENAIAASVTYDPETDLIYGLPASIAGEVTEKYILTETGTPAGYLTAPSTEFVMNADGTITVSDAGNAVLSADKLSLMVSDQPIRGHVQLTKTMDKKSLAGVTFALYREAGSGVNEEAEDEKNDVLVAEGITTDENGFWTSEGSQLSFAENSGDNGTLAKGLPSGSYYFVETKATADSVLDAATHAGKFTIDANGNGKMTSQPAAVSVKITNDAFTADVQLTKLDAESGNPIPEGVSFTLTRDSYHADGMDYPAGNAKAYTKIKTVDSNGTITFEGLTKGTYTLTEVKDPKGYENGDNDAQLFKATFEIGEADAGQLIMVTPDAKTADGTSPRFTLERGSWSEQGILNTPKKATVYLYKKGKNGVDSEISEALKGVTFKLQKQVIGEDGIATGWVDWMTGLTTGNVYTYTDAAEGTVEPDKDAVIPQEDPLVITGLKWGSYRLVETNAKDGYAVTDENGNEISASFVVEQSTDFDNAIKLGTDGHEIFNYKTRLRLLKNGVGETQNLAGAVFEITGRFADGSVSKIVTTDANGHLTIEDKDTAVTTLEGLLKGGETYTLKELVPPAGYEKIATEVTFTMETNGKVKAGNGFADSTAQAGYVLGDSNDTDYFDNVITVIDQKVQVQLEKYSDDEDAKALTGAEFVVTPVKGETENSDKFADGSTSITLNDQNMAFALEGQLIAGNEYQVKETKAPAGYKLTETFTFLVKDDGSVEITNPAVNNPAAVTENNGISIIRVSDARNLLVIRKTDERDKVLDDSALKQVVLQLTDITENISEEEKDHFEALTFDNLTELETSSEDDAKAEKGWILDGKLTGGHTYQLEETGIPVHYLKAPVVIFEMGTDGKITVQPKADSDAAVGNNLYLTATDKNTFGICDTKINATVTIVKKDQQTGSPIQGVQFKFYQQNGDTPDPENDILIADSTSSPASEVWTTDQDGKITIQGVSEGSYYFTEVKADGYVFDSSAYYQVTVGKSADKKLTEVRYDGTVAQAGSLVNEKNKLTIQKIDGDGNPLPEKSMDQLTLVLKDTTDPTQPEIELTTDTAGKAYTYNKDKGTWTLEGLLIQGHTYELTEKARPYGYYIAKTITFTLGEENKIQDISGADAIQTQPEAGTENLYSESQLYVRDVKINGSLKLTKTITQGEEEKETLAGVTFALYLVKGSDERTLREEELIADPEKDGTPVRTGLITGANGTLTVSDLPEGSYYFKETAAPGQVYMDAGVTDIVTIDHTYTKTLEVKKDNIPFTTKVELVKTDSTSGDKIPDTTFELYRKGENDFELLDFADTDAEGKISFTITEAGKYRVVEKKAAYGYKLDPETPYTAEFTICNTEPFQNNVLTLSNTTDTSVTAKEDTLSNYELEIENALAAAEAAVVTNNRLTGTVTLKKAEKAGEEMAPLKDVTFGLYQKAEETLLRTGKTGEDGTLTFDGLTWGSYYIREQKADGYKIDSNKRYEFTIGNVLDEEANSGIEVDLGIIENEKNKLTITKIDESGELLNEESMKELELTLTDITEAEVLEALGDEAVKEQILTADTQNENKEWVLEGVLLTGHTYQLKETKRPYGYLTADDIIFTMEEDGTIQVVSGATEEGATKNLFTAVSLTVRDIKILTDLKLVKKDPDGNALKNAVFTLYRMTGEKPDTSVDEIVKENLSTDEEGQLLVKDLPEGKYYFTETAAPEHIFMNGVSSEVLTVDSDTHGKTVETEVENQAFTANVSLTKTDLDTGAGLEGAEFTLYRRDAEGIYGEVVRQEADKDGKVSFTLTQSGSYKVVETKGAYGYDYHAKNPYTAEFSLTNTEEFQNSRLILADKVSEETAKKYGLIITGNLSEKTDSVTNKKTPEEDTGAITVTKYLQLDGLISGLEMGAKEAVFYTALFTDPEGTRRYSEVKELHIKDGNSTSVTFEGLPEGTYYVFETQADGTVIPYEQLTKDSAGNQFYCTGTDTTAIEISPQQKEKSAELYNWYLDLPDGYYLSGKLEITKNVIKAGKTITAEDTFYAGIFDESGELVSVVELVQNDTVSVEVKLGGEKNTEPITYTVKETDAQGNPVDDSFPYEVTVSGDGTISKEKTTAKVEITNTVKEDPQPTVSPEPTDTPEPTVTPGTTSDVKTGDDTQTQPFVFLLVVSGCVLLYVGRKKQKSA